jgi:hypothetical protein
MGEGGPEMPTGLRGRLGAHLADTEGDEHVEQRKNLPYQLGSLLHALGEPDAPEGDPEAGGADPEAAMGSAWDELVKAATGVANARADALESAPGGGGAQESSVVAGMFEGEAASPDTSDYWRSPRGVVATIVERLESLASSGAAETPPMIEEPPAPPLVDGPPPGPALTPEPEVVPNG